MAYLVLPSERDITCPRSRTRRPSVA